MLKKLGSPSFRIGKGMGKRPRIDEPSQTKIEKTFYRQEYSMGNKNRDPKQNSQGGGHDYERSRCGTCGK